MVNDIGRLGQRDIVSNERTTKPTELENSPFALLSVERDLSGQSPYPANNTEVLFSLRLDI